MKCALSVVQWLTECLGERGSRFQHESLKRCGISPNPIKSLLHRVSNLLHRRNQAVTFGG